jgi:hypothetical protein
MAKRQGDPRPIKPTSYQIEHRADHSEHDDDLGGESDGEEPY